MTIDREKIIVTRSWRRPRTAKRSVGHGVGGKQLKELDAFIVEAKLKNDPGEWRRGRAVRAYIDKRRAIDIVADFGVTRGSVNRWLQWYEADHVEGRRTTIAEGPAPKLTDQQRSELVVLVKEGTIART